MRLLEKDPWRLLETSIKTLVPPDWPSKSYLQLLEQIFNLVTARAAITTSLVQ